jgi:hypothetical protein
VVIAATDDGTAESGPAGVVGEAGLVLTDGGVGSMPRAHTSRVRSEVLPPHREVTSFFVGVVGTGRV